MKEAGLWPEGAAEPPIIGVLRDGAPMCGVIGDESTFAADPKM